MTRAALLAAGLLTLAACSSGGEAEPPPPLDTEAPTTTVEAPPTTEAPETTTSTTATTAVAETTTTGELPETTTTPPPVQSAPVADVHAAAFSGYESAWSARRAAIRQPTDEAFRVTIMELYIDNGNRAGVFEFIDSIAATDERSVEEAGNPNSVEFLEGGVVTEDQQVAQILVCEVLNDDVIDGDGNATFTEPFSYRLQIFMQLEDGIWKVQSESIDEEFPNEADCA